MYSIIKFTNIHAVLRKQKQNGTKTLSSNKIPDRLSTKLCTKTALSIL